MSKSYTHPTIREALAANGIHLPPRPAPAAAPAPASGRLRESRATDEEYRAAAREIVALGEAREPERVDHSLDRVFGRAGARFFEEEPEAEPDRPGDHLFGSADRDPIFGDASAPAPEPEARWDRFQEQEPATAAPDRAFDRIFGPAD